MICTELLLEKMHILMEFSAIINSSLDTSHVRERAIQAASKLLQADAGSLLLVDPETNELFFEVATGDKGEKLKEIRLKAGEGIAGWVVQSGEPVLTNDVQGDPRFYKVADQTSSYETRSMVAVPVKSGKNVIGVLQAVNKCRTDFTPEDLKMLTTLAHQVGPAIENARMYETMRESFYGVSMALAEALEKRDYYTGGHTNRVSAYCMAIGTRLDLGEKEMESLWLASILHDIGKIGVEDRVLQKPGKLDDEEFGIMSRHSEYGSEILSHIRSHRIVVPGVRGHHEKYDGTGYPDRLKGDEIPLVARIIAVADAFDAMTSDRPYRNSLTHRQAFAELERCSGTQFDPDVVGAFLAAYRKG
jgi:HD-GYP domain-containing protein (c-di-GMP phosphodiesterase class II)